ncbi:RHS repeat-associated core domain-containing protein [Pseudomonas sp. Sample_22]|jgi:RHS repeat-associated protein|uniref:RHS repeat-associated core domain-containing protein n=1 Tax=Pseudomonas sp. Sample_22 TaxID=2448266 RepID=UPI0010329C27|nr:RHS repeat-associated core domain-containing protein [Pseudomonas sp. Sample_22]
MPIARNIQPLKSCLGETRFARTLLLASNQQQSVLAELDRTGPNPFAYSPYGLQSAQRRAGTHLGFNGQFKEGATGWYHLGNGHRVYSPVLMRFHSPDRLSPFGKGGINSYAYCMGDPVNATDPTGQVPEWLQPILTIGLHVGIIAATAITAIANPPAGLALWAARTSLVGSPVAIAGSVMQLAGYKEEGRIVSAIGTTFSIGAVTIRAGVGIQKIISENNPLLQMRKGLGNLFTVNKKPTAARGVTSSSPQPGEPGLELSRLSSTIAAVPETTSNQLIRQTEEIVSRL